MQINPFEANPKGRKSPLFSDDDDPDTPTHGNRASTSFRPSADFAKLFAGFSSVSKSNGNDEYKIRDCSPEQNSSLKSTPYTVPKFLVSHEFTTVDQFRKKHPNYSKKIAQEFKSEPMSMADDLAQTLKKLKPNNSVEPNMAIEIDFGAQTPPKHERVMKTTITSVKKERKYNDIADMESDTTEKRRHHHRKYPSSYEDDKFIDSESEKSSECKKRVSRLETDYINLGVTDLIHGVI